MSNIIFGVKPFNNNGANNFKKCDRSSTMETPLHSPLRSPLHSPLQPDLPIRSDLSSSMPLRSPLHSPLRSPLNDREEFVKTFEKLNAIKIKEIKYKLEKTETLDDIGNIPQSLISKKKSHFNRFNDCVSDDYDITLHEIDRGLTEYEELNKRRRELLLHRSKRSNATFNL